MSKKNTIKLTESDLHNIIKESVNNILKEYKNSSTRFYNDRIDYYLSQGYDINDAKLKAQRDVSNNGVEKRMDRNKNRYIFKTEDELATERGISNFMDDKDDEWWKSGKNKIVNIHRSDDEGNEWDEEFVDSYPCRYKPSPNVFKKYMQKHNKPLDTRYGIEREK